MSTFEITVNVPGLHELAQSVELLAVAMKSRNTIDVEMVPEKKEPVPAVTANASPVVRPVPATQQETAAHHPEPEVQAVKTSAVSYQLDDLARAARTLMDSGRQSELQQLLTAFGVMSLPELPADRYGAFATALREKGAQI